MAQFEPLLPEPDSPFDTIPSVAERGNGKAGTRTKDLTRSFNRRRGVSAGHVDENGLGVASASLFIVQAILLTVPMPRALNLTGIPAGVVLLLVLPSIMAYMSVLLGRCLVIMKNRWPDKYGKQRIRSPFPEIGKAAGGRIWEIVVWISIMIANFGASVVGVLVAVSSVTLLIPDFLSDRLWLLVVLGVAMPMTWPGSPMHSFFVGWASAVGALLSTTLVLAAIIVAGLSPALPSTTGNSTLLVATSEVSTASGAIASTSLSSLVRNEHSDMATSFTTFWMGTSMIIFTLTGMSLYPTIQNDMRKPQRWPLAVVPAYIVSVAYCMSTGVVGVEMFHSSVHPNILYNVQCHSSKVGQVLGKAAAGIYIVNGIGEALISSAAVAQEAEELLKLPSHKVNYKHILVRSGVWLVIIGVAVAVPHFHKYQALVGATTVCMNNFIFPPLFYYWLMKSGEDHLKVSICENLVFTAVVIFGAVAITCGTYTSMLAFLSDGEPRPC